MTVTWAQLLATPDGSYGLYADYAAVILLQAKDPENARGSLGLATEVIATKALLHDIPTAKAFVGAIAAVFKVEGEFLEMLPDMQTPMWAANLASVEIASETVGAPLRLPAETELPRRLDKALKEPPADKNELTVALLSLLRGEVDRIEDYVFSSKWVRTLIAALQKGKPAAVDSFERYLRDFPELLIDQATTWQHLLLAAAFVLGDVSGAPRSGVAETLRTKIRELAG